MREENKPKKTTAKKTVKKATPKTTKKTTTKKVATKVAKTTKKTVAKKPAAKVTAKKTTAKKTTTKATAKKTTAKKTTKTPAKTIRKTTTKKPATRVAKVADDFVEEVDVNVNDKVVEMQQAVANEVTYQQAPIIEPAQTVESAQVNPFTPVAGNGETNNVFTPQKEAKQTDSQEEKKARKGGRKVIVTMVVIIILAVAVFLGLWYFSKITAHNKVVETLDKLKAGDQDVAIELIDLKKTLGLEAELEDDVNDVSDLLLVQNQEPEVTEGASQEVVEGEQQEGVPQEGVAQEGVTQEAQEIQTQEDETTSLTNEIIQQNKKDEKDYIDFFKRMEYEIIEEKADFVEGYVKVRISNKNIGSIIKKYYIRAFALSIQSAFSTQQSAKVQENLDKYLKQLLTSDEIERVATEVTFKLVRDGFEWKLEVNQEALCDAILPGLREQLKDFEF